MKTVVNRPRQRLVLRRTPAHRVIRNSDVPFRVGDVTPRMSDDPQAVPARDGSAISARDP